MAKNASMATANLSVVGEEQMPAEPSLLRRIYESDWFSYVPAIVGIFVIWQLATDVFKVPAYLIPPPASVFEAMVKHWPLLMREALATLREILGGFVLAVVTAIPLALMIVYSRVFERFVNPLIII